MDRKDCGRCGSGDGGGGPGDSERHFMDRIELGRAGGAGEAAGEGRCLCLGFPNLEADELR